MPFLPFIFFFLYGFVSSDLLNFNCTYPIENGACVLFENNLVFTNSNQISLYNTTKLIINQSTMRLDDSALFKNCALHLENLDEIQIIDSKLNFTIIHINTTNLILSNATLTTNTSVKYNLKVTDEKCQGADVGIGYAGVGAFCQESDSECISSYSFFDYLFNSSSDSTLFLGSGAGQLINDFYGAAGGRILCQTTNFRILSNSSFFASGSPQEKDFDCRNRMDKDVLNGGTGGYIYVKADNFERGEKKKLGGQVNDRSGNEILNEVRVVERRKLEETQDRVLLKIVAEGGNYCEKETGLKTLKFGGSGGRVVVDLPDPPEGVDVAYFLRGGIADSSVLEDSRSSCKNGAAGSLYFLRNKTLIFDNNGNEASSVSIVTPGLNDTDLEKIIARNGSKISHLKDSAIKAKNIEVSDSYINYQGASPLNISSLLLNISSSGSSLPTGIGHPDQDVKASLLWIVADSLVLSTNTTLRFGKEFKLDSNNLELRGKVESLLQDSLLLVASNYSKVEGASLEAERISFYSDNNLVFNNSELKAFKTRCRGEEGVRRRMEEEVMKRGGKKKRMLTGGWEGFLNPLDWELDLSRLAEEMNITGGGRGIAEYLIQVYTLVILVPKGTNLTFISNGMNSNAITVKGANIGLFAHNISISKNNTISSQDLGCANEAGPGKGHQDQNLGSKCGGTGGSYGGYGSFAWSNYSDINKDCLKIKSDQIYGDIENPIFEGSGGGGKSQQMNSGGRGGGVIIIGALFSLDLNGTIISSGSPPESQMGKATAGSGSGGSIQLFMEEIRGTGSILSEGGNVLSSGIGGPGGGGRIRIHFLKWWESRWFSQEWKGSFSVDSGNRSQFVNKPANMILLGRGTISTVPCMPGYYGNVCSLCPPGKYKNTIGTGDCFDCANKPTSAYYVSDPYSRPPIFPNCSYECTGNLIAPKCETSVDNYVRNFGGYPGIVGISIALMIILGIIGGRFFKKKKGEIKGSMDRSEGEACVRHHQKTELSKINFCMDDMPYHLKRIYLCGENSGELSWELNRNEHLDMAHNEINIVQYNNLIKVVNAQLKYSKFASFTLVFFNWVYYPLYYLLIYLFRRRNHKKMMSLIPNFNVLYRNQDQMEETPLFLKFSSTPDHTLGFIDILNYKKSLEEWSSLKFPVSLILAGEGSFLFPLFLNLDDPYIKTLCSSINEVSTSDEPMWPKESIMLASHPPSSQTGPKLTFQDFLKRFNEKARRIDFWLPKKEFLRAFQDLLDFIAKSNEDYLAHKGISAKLFLHKMKVREKEKEKEEGGKKEEGGRRREEGGRRMEEGGRRRNEEGGRRREEGGGRRDEEGGGKREEGGNSMIWFLEGGGGEEKLEEAQKWKFWEDNVDVKFSLNLMKVEEGGGKGSGLMEEGGGKKLKEEEKKEDEDELEELKKQFMMKSQNANLSQTNTLGTSMRPFLSNESKCPDSLHLLVKQVGRWGGLFRSFFLRFRSERGSTSLLPVSLFLLLIVDLVMIFVLVWFLVEDGEDMKVELYYVYPLSPFVATVLFFVWFGCYSNNILIGKIFLIFDCLSLFDMVVGFFIAIATSSKNANGPLKIIVHLLFAALKYLNLFISSKYLSLK